MSFSTRISPILPWPSACFSSACDSCASVNACDSTRICPSVLRCSLRKDTVGRLLHFGCAGGSTAGRSPPPGCFRGGGVDDLDLVRFVFDFFCLQRSCATGPLVLAALIAAVGVAARITRLPAAAPAAAVARAAAAARSAALPSPTAAPAFDAFSSGESGT